MYFALYSLYKKVWKPGFPDVAVSRSMLALCILGGRDMTFKMSQASSASLWRAFLQVRSEF